LIIYDNLSRVGSEENLKWLREENINSFEFIKGDVRDFEVLCAILDKEKPDVIYHLAGQVAMTVSIANPSLDFQTNVLGSFNVLEAVRRFSCESIIAYSSTNKVYGDLDYLDYYETDTRYICKQYPNGFDENIKLEFCSPYGCSKGSADQYMLDYARIFNIKTVVFRHSSMYGPRQFGTYDQGWISWFCRKALETKNNKNTIFTISGNGKQVRDVLYCDDLINLYMAVPNHIDRVRGKVFNIGGGMGQSLSLLELFSFFEKELNIKLRYDKLSVRNSDQKFFVADIKNVKEIFSWYPKISYLEGLKQVLNWTEKLMG
jgi:CDP-paratose 2-epimerase